MFNPLKLLNDPEYQKLSPDEQRTARQMYFERVLSKDTYYTSLSSVAQESLKKQFNIEPEKKAGRTLKERIGFEGPGLVEGLTGSQLGKVVDIPLRVLGIPGALAGSTVEDITGSGSLGGLTRLGVDLFLGAKGLGALKSLRAGKGAIPATTGEMSISAPMAEASGQLTLPGISGIGAKAPSFEEGALRAKAALGKIEGLTKPQTSRELQLSMQKGSLEAEQLELNLARPDWRMERYPNVGIKLVGSANAAFEKLWGREQGAAEAFRQLWGQKGKTGAGLLPIGAGAAVGGAIGGLTAESPEDRMRNALIGAGIGGATAGVLLGIGRSKPVLAGLGGALIKEAGGYQAVTKTGKVAGIIETDALPIQISEAAKLGARAKNSLPSGLRDAVDALDGDGINLTIFKAKTRLEQLTPRIFGVNPRDLARNIPGMGPIANTLEEAADYAKAFEGWFVENVNTIYKPLTKKHSSIEKVNAFLDGQKVTLTGTEQSVAANARVLYDKAFALLGIPEEKRVLDYFTRLRKTVAVDSAYVTMGGRDIPIRGMIELVEGNLYVPLRVESSLPKNYTPFFMKERTTELAATDLGMAPMLAYARGFGRRLALSGGINPYTGEQVVGALSKLKNQLPNLPDNSEVLQYNAKWINQFLGVPTGVRGGAFGANTEMVVAEMKKWQFLRTLALNPLSAMLNLTQSLNTFAKSSVGSWLGAFNDMLDPAKRLMAKQQGIVGELAKADIDALTQTPFTELSARLLQKAGFMFSKSETMVRQHAFFTGLRDAAKRGLIGEDALTYARKLTSETQYRFGKEGLPATFREQGAGQLLSQFKTYPVNQMLFMKNLLVDDIADLRKMQGIPFKRMSKFFGSTIALVGSDAATLGLDKSISKFFTDNEETLRVTGFFPSMGMYLAGQLGMGVLPVEDLRSLFFFLPGPALANVMDSISVGSYLANKNSPDAPWGKNYSIGPGFGEPMTAEQLATRITRFFPGGVMANRLRRAYAEAQTPGEVREAATLKQAFSKEPFTGKERLLEKGTSEYGPLRTAIGFQSPERAARSELGGEQVDIIEARNKTVRNAARFMAIGKQKEALDLLKAFEKKYGISARISPASIRSALLSAAVPQEERRIKKTPRELRGALMKELLDLQD